MKKNGFILCLLAMSFICCTNWQEEYKKRLTDASEPIKGKIDFFNEKYSGIERNANSVCYTKLEEVRLNDAKRIFEALPEETDQKNHSTEFVILNVPDSSGCDLNDHIFYNFDEELYNEDYSYYTFFNYDLIFLDMNKDQMNYYLSRFEKEIVQPLESAKYLLVIKDKILVKPNCPLYGNEFTGGYVLSNVEVYDLNTKQLIDSFDVSAKNSNNVSVKTDLSYSFSRNGKVDISGTGFTKDGDWTLTQNLYSCLKKNAESKAKQRLKK